MKICSLLSIIVFSFALSAHAQNSKPDPSSQDGVESKDVGTPAAVEPSGSTSSGQVDSLPTDDPLGFLIQDDSQEKKKQETTTAAPQPSDQIESAVVPTATPENDQAPAETEAALPPASDHEKSSEATAAASTDNDGSDTKTIPVGHSQKRLEEIVVTATKTEQSVRNIPVSVQAMKGEDLVQQGATTLEDMLKNAPAVNITEEEVSIRGVGLTALQTGNQGHETGFFLGESPMSPPSTGGANIDFDPYDLSTVEILEGPQSTLFGGTALGGAIRYIPNKPELGSLHISARAGYGNLSNADGRLKDISAMMNLPFGDTFAARAVGTIRQRPNVGKNTNGSTLNLNKSEIRQGRILARWMITDDLTADVIYSHMGKDGHLVLLDHPDSYDTGLNYTNQPDSGNANVGSLNLTYKFDSLSIVGVVNTLKNYRDSILDAGSIIGIPGSLVTLPAETKAKASVPSYEIRIVSSHPSESPWWLFEGWDYIAGLYYMKADQNTLNTLDVRAEVANSLLSSILPGGLGLQASGSAALVDVSEKALYVNLNRALFDQKLDFNVGARFAKTTLRSDEYQILAGLKNQEVISSGDGHRINPKVALTWHFTDSLNVRASMSEGFRFGGANSSVTMQVENIPATFHSDSLKNYEVGLRSDWLDDTLRFDVTAYQIDWTDLQVTQISPLASNYTSNIGAAKIDGLEAQLAWSVPDDLPFVPEGLTLMSGVSLINGRTTESFSSANGQVPAGTRLPLSARTSATFGISWVHPLKEWLLSSNVQASYAGKRTNELIVTHTMSPYTVVDASLRLANPTWPGSPAISISGVNLTNQFILNFANPTTVNPQQFTYTAQGPRAVKLSFECSF